MYIGAAYYPEFYDREKWRMDAGLMQQAHFNSVRLGEFAWCRLEPEEGVFHFDWLDEAIEVFAQKGIKTVLGTPTGAPPHWLLKKYQDILPVDERGYRLQIGSFGVYCRNNPVFLEYVRRIVIQMANHYKGNSDVILYQIDNEIPADPCYCEHCKNAFQTWAKKQHKTIEAYNKHLMTIFQGRELGGFEDIFLPTKSRTFNPPALLSEYAKFVSETSVSYCRFQTDIIHQIDPDTPVTTNYDANYSGFDHFKTGEFLDLTALDVYPKGDSQFDVELNSFMLDFARSTAYNSKDFWILEQQCSPVAFKPKNYPLAPGEALLYTCNSLAHGADHIMYFRFNSTHNGGERFGAGILRHDNKPGRTYQEICDITQKLETIAPYLENSCVKPAKVAIVYSYFSRWMIQTPKAIFEDLSYEEEIMCYYRYCHKNNIPVDFVKPMQDLDQYDIILAPMFASVTSDEVQWLESSAAQGKTVVCGALSGLYNEYNEITSEYYQGKLKNLLGIKVTEWYIPYGNKNGAVEYGENTYNGDKLNMIMELETAQAIAYYSDDFYAGTPAVTKNQFGKGTAYYIGVLGGQLLLNRLFDDILLKYCTIDEKVRGKDVTVCTRISDKYETIFILNPDATSHIVQLEETYWDLFKSKEVQGCITIPEKGTIVLKKDL